ncbi:MAG: hypothetical protein ACXWQO_01070 [Bdellovibrionota bacterium]
MMNKAEKWRQVRSMMMKALGISVTAAVAFSYYFWALPGAAITLAAALCLALGLWVTEMLVAVLTGVRKANATAIMLLFTGKFLWWGGLIVGARALPPGNEKPIALGIIAFLLSILVTGIAQYGMPTISEVQE